MAHSTDNLLVFKDPSLAKGLEGLARELQENPSTQEEISYNPVGVMQRHFTPTVPIPPSEISAANQLVMSMLSNDGFRGWLADYNKQFSGSAESLATLDRQKVLSDFSSAMIKHGDADMMKALLDLGNTDVTTTGYYLPDTPIPPYRPGGIDPRLANTWYYTETVVAVLGVALIHVVATAIDFTPMVPNEVRFGGTEAAQILTNAGERVLSTARMVRAARGNV